jgi:hypothetical protein
MPIVAKNGILQTSLRHRQDVRAAFLHRVCTECVLLLIPSSQRRGTISPESFRFQALARPNGIGRLDSLAPRYPIF